jgi:dTDP-4-amino-4,6-dideoxygalactose transaminase
MDPIMAAAGERSIPVIEDAAQAIGARYKDKAVGSIGTMACLSFYPTKNLGCYGDGGMVLTNDAMLAKRLASLRAHGQTGKYSYELIGFNSRLDSIQAAILLVKFKRLKDWNDARRAAAGLYDEMLQGLPVETPRVADYAYHVYHQYTLKADRRDDLRASLTGKEIGTAVHYPLGLHLQEAYRKLGRGPGDLPNCEDAAGRVISLPMFPEIEHAEVEFVAQSIREFYENI